MVKNGRYYSLVGRNCVAVFNSWDYADKSRKYAVRPYFRKFDTFFQAEAYALEQFLQFYPQGYPPIKQLEVNQIIFTKNQRPENVMAAVTSVAHCSSMDNTNDAEKCPDEISEPAEDVQNTVKNDGAPEKYVIKINL